MTQIPPNNSKPLQRFQDEVDLTQVLTVLRRYWVPLLLTPLLLAGTTYLLSERTPPTYEASTSLMSTAPDTGNSAIAASSITATQLPQGAVDKVVHSRSTYQVIEKLLSESSIPTQTQTRIKRDLQRELATQRFNRLKVKARLDQLQRGVYDLTAVAETPQAAQILATAATQALLEWDLRRAQEGVGRAKRNIQQQLENVNKRIASSEAGSVEQQSLISARGQLILNLSQATAFEEGARGSLTLLAEANAPLAPIAPKPRRNAALVFVLSLFIGGMVALLLDAMRRKIRSTAELLPLNLPALGELPRLPGMTRSQLPEIARAGAFYEPSGFLRVNLLSLVPQSPAIVGVTSARPGEGKSTVAATLATSLATVGKRVLVIDLDLHRPTQHEYWQVIGRPWVALPGAEGGKQTTVIQALQEPHFASAVDVGNGIHFLPAGEGGRHAAAVLSSPAFAQQLRTWSQGYDLVLLDTPPVLAMADAFIVGKQADGLILVVESGVTSVPEIQRVEQSFQTTGVRLLGVLVNKVKREREYYYNYGVDSVSSR